MGGCNSGQSAAERSYAVSEVRGSESARLRQHRSSREQLPLPKARRGSREEQPHTQGAVAVRVPEALEELFHVQGRRGSN